MVVMTWCRAHGANLPYAAVAGAVGGGISWGMAVDLHDVRDIAMSLPRTEEHLIRQYVKFRVGRIVYASVSPDEELMGFGYPREERAELLAAEPDKFVPPVPSDERYQWVRVRLAAIDETELRELLVDAWRMVVPKRVAREHLESGAT
jgi:hypothetical protein